MEEEFVSHMVATTSIDFVDNASNLDNSYAYDYLSNKVYEAMIPLAKKAVEHIISMGLSGEKQFTFVVNISCKDYAHE